MATHAAFTEEILAVDIATFMIAVVVGQLISYRLFRKSMLSNSTEIIAIFLMALLALVFQKL